jgi:hypothetical protein
MGRIGRSLLLVSQSYRVLIRDKELMVLPLVSGTAIALVCASFFLAFGVKPEMVARREPAALIPLFLMYLVAYSIGLFFQAAVIAGATERLNGGDPTLGSALSAARRRIGPLLLWATLAATVGVILRQIQEQTGIIGKVVVGLVGAAWSIATFFVVPVLVLENLSLRESMTRSLAVIRETWGESLVGNLSIGVIAAFAWACLVALLGLVAWSGAGIWVSLGVGFVGAATLMAFFSTLQGIYVATLYRFATGGANSLAASGLDADLFGSAFKPR